MHHFSLTDLFLYSDYASRSSHTPESLSDPIDSVPLEVLQENLSIRFLNCRVLLS